MLKTLRLCNKYVSSYRLLPLSLKAGLAMGGGGKKKKKKKERKKEEENIVAETAVNSLSVSLQTKFDIFDPLLFPDDH